MLRKIIGGFFIALPFIGLFVFIFYEEEIKVILIVVISIVCIMAMFEVIHFLNLLRRKK